MFLPGRSWTKCDGVVSSVTGESAGGVVVSVTVRSGARRLEYLGVHRRLARRRCIERAAAAVLRVAERLAGALTRPSVRNLQFHRASVVEVGGASSGQASPRSAAPLYDNWQIVAIHEAHIVIVLTTGAESELGERRRRGGSGSVALHLTGAAVAGGAGALARPIKFTAGSAPEAARPARRSMEAT